MQNPEIATSGMLGLVVTA